MKIFLTGATGFLGSAIGEGLAKSGHEVRGLARSESARREVLDRGWIPVPGDLRDLETLRREAAAADGVVHAANTGGDDAADLDVRATRAILEALEGTDKPFLYTSGVWVLGSTGDDMADETTPTDPAPPLVGWRTELEGEVLAAAARGVRASVVRPGIVVGGGGGILGLLAQGAIPVVGDGTQHWPLVHREDLADLYVKALGVPGGTILHGVSDTATLDELVRAVQAVDPEFDPRRVPMEEARRELGAFADALALDQRVDARRTRAQLDWRPRRAPVQRALAEAAESRMTS